MSRAWSTAAEGLASWALLQRLLSGQCDVISGQAAPLGEEEIHFDLDSWGGWIWPYRVHLAEPGPARVRVTVRNPLPQAADLEVALVGPQGWRGESATLQAGPRREVSCELSIVPDGPCRRQPFAVDLVAGGRPFGQVAEALMTVGGQEF